MTVLPGLFSFLVSLGISVHQGEEFDDRLLTPIDSVSRFELHEPYWVKVDLDISKEDIYYLRAGNWYMKDVQFHDRAFKLLTTGNHLRIRLKEGSHRFFLYYSFPDEKSSKGIEVEIISESAFLRALSKRHVIQAVFNGVLIFLLMTSIFFSIQSRDNVYYHYGFYLLSVILFFSYQNGYLGTLIPLINRIPPSWVWISSASLTVSYVFFARSFLNLKEVAPRAHRITTIGLYYILLVVLIESSLNFIGIDVMHYAWYKYPMLVIQLFLFVLLGIRIFRIRTILSNIFFVGFLILALTTFCGQYFSTSHRVEETNLIIQSGLLLDIFIFTIGIAIRVGLIYKARANAQQKLIDQLRVNEELQSKLTADLEEEVKARTQALERRNKENEILLKEVHHRVKNNLQVISSLLSMQSRREQLDEKKEVLAVTKNRVRSIGLIHEHLYQTDMASGIDLKKYFEDLTDILFKSLHFGSTIDIEIDVQDGYVDVDTAVHLGLILNELVTNSIKYAFLGHESPKVALKIYSENEQLNFQYSDNGAKQFEEPNGFGWIMIRSILESIQGSVEHYFEKGFFVRIFIKDYTFGFDENQGLSA